MAVRLTAPCDVYRMELALLLFLPAVAIAAYFWGEESRPDVVNPRVKHRQDRTH